MSVKFYVDVHVPMAVSRGLRRRGVDLLRSQEDGTTTMDDPDFLDRATALGRVVVTQDQDFLAEAARRQQMGLGFIGVIYAAQGNVSIGRFVTDLELIAKACEPVDLADRVFYLPIP
jgi:predicted nuclease of predicted toxin-antitoxin system